MSDQEKTDDVTGFDDLFKMTKEELAGAFNTQCGMLEKSEARIEEISAEHERNIIRLKEGLIEEIDILQRGTSKKIDAMVAIIGDLKAQLDAAYAEGTRWFSVAKVLISAFGEDAQITVEDSTRKVVSTGIGFEAKARREKTGEDVRVSVSCDLEKSMEAISSKCNCQKCSSEREKN